MPRLAARAGNMRAFWFALALCVSVLFSGAAAREANAWNQFQTAISRQCGGSPLKKLLGKSEKSTPTIRSQVYRWLGGPSALDGKLRWLCAASDVLAVKDFYEEYEENVAEVAVVYRGYRRFSDFHDLFTSLSSKSELLGSATQWFRKFQKRAVAGQIITGEIANVFAQKAANASTLSHCAVGEALGRSLSRIVTLLILEVALPWLQDKIAGLLASTALERVADFGMHVMYQWSLSYVRSAASWLLKKMLKRIVEWTVDKAVDCILMLYPPAKVAKDAFKYLFPSLVTKSEEPIVTLLVDIADKQLESYAVRVLEFGWRPLLARLYDSMVRPLFTKTTGFLHQVSTYFTDVAIGSLAAVLFKPAETGMADMMADMMAGFGCQLASNRIVQNIADYFVRTDVTGPEFPPPSQEVSELQVHSHSSWFTGTQTSTFRPSGTGWVLVPTDAEEEALTANFRSYADGAFGMQQTDLAAASLAAAVSLCSGFVIDHTIYLHVRGLHAGMGRRIAFGMGHVQAAFMESPELLKFWLALPLTVFSYVPADLLRFTIHVPLFCLVSWRKGVAWVVPLLYAVGLFTRAVVDGHFHLLPLPVAWIAYQAGNCLGMPPLSSTVTSVVQSKPSALSSSPCCSFSSAIA